MRFVWFWGIFSMFDAGGISRLDIPNIINVLSIAHTFIAATAKQKTHQISKPLSSFLFPSLLKVPKFNQIPLHPIQSSMITQGAP
jgi:hypothetical protein